MDDERMLHDVRIVLDCLELIDDGVKRAADWEPPYRSDRYLHLGTLFEANDYSATLRPDLQANCAYVDPDDVLRFAAARKINAPAVQIVLDFLRATAPDSAGNEPDGCFFNSQKEWKFAVIVNQDLNIVAS